MHPLKRVHFLLISKLLPARRQRRRSSKPSPSRRRLICALLSLTGCGFLHSRERKRTYRTSVYRICHRQIYRSEHSQVPPALHSRGMGISILRTRHPAFFIIYTIALALSRTLYYNEYIYLLTGESLWTRSPYSYPATTRR